MLIDRINESLDEKRRAISLFFQRLKDLNRPFVLHTDLNDLFAECCDTEWGEVLRDTDFKEMIHAAQEAVIRSPSVFFALRRSIGEWMYIHSHLSEDIYFEVVEVSRFLEVKERIVNHFQDENSWILEVDLGPFSRGFPRMKKKESIGRGVEFLNRHLSGRLFQDGGSAEKLVLEFLRLHQYRGVQLMLNSRIEDVDMLRNALQKADRYLESVGEGVSIKEIGWKLQTLGFEPGWGSSVERIHDTMDLLSDILEAPDHDRLQEFLARIPMIFNLVILSPHGYFGQSGVLGLPDTGGQVVYILDQVRALEEEMWERNAEQGLDITPRILVVTRLIPDAGNTTCNERIEPIAGTKNAKILRVPFRSPTGEVIPYWISRFDLWPYLERYAIEAEKEIYLELNGRPDLVIGNYSDGNLVASLLAQRFGVTQCNIAHALEKTKYLFSELYWKDNEEQYHFSCQFTADLVSMNYADFIITSTYQEIAGNEESMGQYESYSAFTMPHLYRVVNGVDVFDPKFNIVSPGSDPKIYFPYFEEEDRLRELQPHIERILHDPEIEGVRGNFADPNKPTIFLMSRLDKIKNATGFTEWYGQSDRLRSEANLLVAAGMIDPGQSNDDEEKAQVELMHRLMDRYQLDDQVRWTGRMDKNLGGETYRVVADGKGVFVQPALFEAFGLTVIEAMICGLPTFATRYGGPLEIIIDGKSGFHIDPNRGDRSAEKIADFFQRCREEEGYWEQISQGGIDRVEERYTWKLYAKRLMTLSRVYGFWKYMTNLERAETRRYLEMFYGLMLRPRIATVQA